MLHLAKRPRSDKAKVSPCCFQRLLTPHHLQHRSTSSPKWEKHHLGPHNSLLWRLPLIGVQPSCHLPAQEMCFPSTHSTRHWRDNCTDSKYSGYLNFVFLSVLCRVGVKMPMMSTSVQNATKAEVSLLWYLRPGEINWGLGSYTTLVLAIATHFRY